MNKEKPLNSKTPLWFKQWHEAHYRPLKNTVKSNSRWIYLVVAAVVAAGVAGNSNIDAIGRIVKMLIGE